MRKDIDRCDACLRDQPHHELHTCNGCKRLVCGLCISTPAIDKAHLCVFCQEDERQRLRRKAERVAPKLLRVCERLFDHLDGCSHGYPDELWDDAKAVIEEAKGQ